MVEDEKNQYNNNSDNKHGFTAFYDGCERNILRKNAIRQFRYGKPGMNNNKTINNKSSLTSHKMKKHQFFKLITLVLTISIAIPGFSQSYTSGGYQGGTHGNIKYTLWSGAVDDNWAEPGNWCPAVVPDANAEVVVPSGAAVMPEVKSPGMSCKKLTLEPGAEVDIKPGFTLTVNGQEVE